MHHQLSEGVKFGDLEGMVFSSISVDEFQPKSGLEKEIVVVAFYCREEQPANDLEQYLERSSVPIADAEVGQNPDEDGRYIVFVELERNEQFFDHFKKIVYDVETLTGPMVWEVKPYLSNHPLSLDDPNLQMYIITDINSYVSKEEFEKKQAKDKETEELLKDSYINSLKLVESTIIIDNVEATLIETIDKEKSTIYNTRQFFAVNYNPSWSRKLRHLKTSLGENWEVSSTVPENYVLLENRNTNKIIILKI